MGADCEDATPNKQYQQLITQMQTDIVGKHGGSVDGLL